MHVRDIAHEHGFALHLGDGEGVDRIDDIRAVVHRQLVVLAADLDVAGRQDDVLALQGVADLGRREPPRRERVRVQIGHDDARLAAVGLRYLGAMHHREVGADDVLAQVVELGVGQRLARKAQLNDRHVGGAVADHQRRRDVGRHVLEHHQRAAGQLGDGAADVRALMQVDLFHAYADIARCLDARDVIDQRCHLPLVQRQDAVLDVLRTHAVVGPDDADHWNVDLGKDIDRHARGCPDPEQTDQNQHGRNRVRMLEHKTDQGHDVGYLGADSYSRAASVCVSRTQ